MERSTSPIDQRDDPRGMLSTAARGARSSAIRDLLAHARRDGVISLAGGLPSPELFPCDRLTHAAAAILAEPAHLQYGPTEGEMPLREWIADTHSRIDDRTIRPEDVQIVSGSQQALDLITRVLIDPGDQVVVAEPEYLGAIGAFRQARAELVGIPVDSSGLDIDVLAQRLRAGLRPKICYLVPEFHNPTGATISALRLRQLADLADSHGFIIMEDNPYGALRFDGDPVPSVATMTDNVVQCRTISKTLAPGLRVAWMIGPRWLLDAVRIAKQSADLHTPTITQHLALSVMNDEHWYRAHLARLVPHYRERRDALVESLRSDLPAASFDEPSGGMFLWLTFGDGTDTSELLPRALENGVAFVPGAAFAVETPPTRSLRLSYATASPSQLREGVRRLAASMRSPRR